MPLLPWIDTGELQSRLHDCAACTCCPSAATSREWQHTQDYWREKDELPAIDLDDKAFVYS